MVSAEDIVQRRASMSHDDAEWVECLLAELATRADRLHVLEWGVGISTAYFSTFLSVQNIPYYWMAIEHSSAFLERTRLGEVFQRSSASVVTWRPGAARPWEPRGYGLEVVVAEGDPLSIGRFDDYVSLPRTAGLSFDLILVDGRMRRRCLLEASQLMRPGGVTVLHDASRAYYQCSFRAFNMSTFVGDDLWLGMR